PYAHRVRRRAADGPGVAEPITGAGLPGHARAVARVEGVLAAAGARAPLEDVAHDPGGAFRHQATLLDRAPIAGLVAHARGQAAALQRDVAADQLLQRHAG